MARLNGRTIVGVTVFAALSAMGVRSHAQDISSPADASGIVKRYCVGCHNQRTKSANLTLEDVDFNDVGAHADRLEKVVRKMNARSMPPEGARRPDDATYRAFTRWLEAGLDRAAAATVRPGRTEPLHRLNRTEYANAVR